jgi:hypothetical protein
VTGPQHLAQLKGVRQRRRILAACRRRQDQRADNGVESRNVRQNAGTQLTQPAGCAHTGVAAGERHTASCAPETACRMRDSALSATWF